MANWNCAIEARSYGQTIRNIRKAKGIKQEVLAEKVHMSQQAVSRYEQMEVIDDGILVRFAKALEVTVDDIKSIVNGEILSGIGISQEIFESVDPYEQMRTFIGKVEIKDAVNAIGNGNQNIERQENRDPESMALIKEQLDTLHQEKEELQKKLDAERQKSDNFAVQLTNLMQKLADKL